MLAPSALGAYDAVANAPTAFAVVLVHGAIDLSHVFESLLDCAELSALDDSLLLSVYMLYCDPSFDSLSLSSYELLCASSSVP